MKDGLSIGHVGTLAWDVTPDRTIGLGGGRAVVFSTPSMINLMEHAARAALGPYLDDNEESVGVDVSVTHLAATPAGGVVRGEARVTGIDGRLISFDIAAFDAAEQIGRGAHRRAVINVDKFARKLAEKGAPAVTAVGRRSVNEPVLKPDRGELPRTEALGVAVAGQVMTITLNRPAALNAINPQMSGELRKLLDWLAGHPEAVRVVIVTGAGKGFCAGDDMKLMDVHTVEQAEAWNVSEAELFLAFQRVPQTFIAAINGPCFGGGIVLAVACDFRIASRAATFGMPEVKLGWPPAFALPQLAALVGKANALDLCLRCPTIAAERALAIGLVGEVVAPNLVMRTAEARAAELLAMAPIALRETRLLIHRIVPNATPLTETLTNAAYVRCLQTQDTKEGLASFREKRKAKYTDR